MKSGDLLREEDVLEWLVQNKNTASEEEDMIEDVTAKTLETLTSTAPHLAVLFCKISSRFFFCLCYHLNIMIAV